VSPGINTEMRHTRELTDDQMESTRSSAFLSGREGSVNESLTHIIFLASGTRSEKRNVARVETKGIQLKMDVG
jgi:hypothetical protein